MMNNDFNSTSKETSLNPSSVNSIPISLNQKNGVASPAHSISFPFSEISSSPSKAENFPLKATFITDAFLHELENTIFKQSQLIEKQLKDIKESTHTTDANAIVENLLREEEWTSDLLNTTETKIQEGMDYFEKIFPPSILNKIQSQHKETFKEISNLRATLLGALSNGSKHVSLICKTHLLNQSRALLQEVKIHFLNHLTAYQSKKMKKKQKEETHIELTQMAQKINEWDSQIILEENNLKKEEKSILSFGNPNILMPSYDTYRFLNFYQPFKSSKQFLLNSLSFLADFSWLSKGFNVIKGAFDLYKVRGENAIFSDWKKSFNKWKSENESLEWIRADKSSSTLFLHSAEEHKQNLLETVKTKKFLLARNKLKNCGIKLPSTIHNKKTLIDYLEIHSEIINQYVEYRQKIETLNYAISISTNLLEKRNLIVEKKLLLLAPRFDIVEAEIKKRKLEAFKKNLQLTSLDEIQKQQFNNWFAEQNKDNLMREYIDHQETIEITVKNSLKSMIQHKHKLESHFQKLKSTDTHTQFTMTTLLFAASTTLAILGILSIPLGGLGFILLGLSMSSTLLLVGFLTVGYLYALCYKPHTSKTLTIPFQIRMSIASIRQSIAIYFHQCKEKKLLEIATTLHQLHTSSPSVTQTDRLNNPTYQAALAAYQKAKLNFEKSEEQVKLWDQKLRKYESILVEAQWKDFSKFDSWDMGNKSEAFDMLYSFQEAVKSSDFRFLSAETRYLFEAQLGINLENLQNEMRKDPNAVKNAMQSFFALTDTKLFDFIRNQQERINKGMIARSSFA